MKNCYILIGVPASGKSTWVNNNVNLYEAIASSDNTIETVAEEYGFTYSETFNNLIKFATMVFERDLEVAIELEKNIVIDRTNLTPKVRKRFIDMFKKAGYTVIAVVFETPEADEWKRRLDSRPGKFIPQTVLDSMSKNFVYPNVDEGFDYVIKGDL